MKLTASSAVIINSKGEILLLKRSTKPKLYHGYWQLPEGKVRRKESAKQAILREVEEEIGFKTKKASFIKTVSFTKQWLGIPIITITRHLYEVMYSANLDKIKLSDEHSDYKWVKLSEVEKIDKLLPGTLFSLNKTGIIS